ncbi:MAG TPA: dienelactone hydrolase family protein [Candidatus Bilamarchaeum sp.]|nr:dienelactone hydrolase family protein [Candidatus Bilamarchaeum sp.]
MEAPERLVRIPAGSMMLEGMLSVPRRAKGIVIFSHGSGSSRKSPRNNYVARELRRNNIGTLLFDLLSEEEDYVYENRFNVGLLTERLLKATDYLHSLPECAGKKIGYFGSSTGSASALVAAAKLGKKISAVVSRGGRPDLAMMSLGMVKCPTLLIVGGNDDVVIELNQQAYLHLKCKKEMALVPNATHLFEEPGSLEDVAKLASKWFKKYLAGK